MKKLLNIIIIIFVSSCLSCSAKDVSEQTLQDEKKLLSDLQSLMQSSLAYKSDTSADSYKLVSGLTSDFKKAVESKSQTKADETVKKYRASFEKLKREFEELVKKEESKPPA
jgi:hypothetical protein